MNPLSFDQARRQGMDKANQVRLQIAQMEAERAQALAEVNRAQALAQAARTTLDPITGQFVTAEPPKSTRVFPIDNYLENYRIEDITTAIQTAWEMMPEKSSGELKYHKDTRLLIAVGTPEQLNLINEIISSLQRQAHGKPGAFMPPAQPMHELTPPPAKPEPSAAPRNPAKQPTAPEKPKFSPDSTLNTQPGIGSIPS